MFERAGAGNPMLLQRSPTGDALEKAKFEPQCDKLRRPIKRFIDAIYGKMTCRCESSCQEQLPDGRR
jgi:hypothetical protein